MVRSNQFLSSWCQLIARQVRSARSWARNSFCLLPVIFSTGRASALPREGKDAERLPVLGRELAGHEQIAHVPVRRHGGGHGEGAHEQHHSLLRLREVGRGAEAPRLDGNLHPVHDHGRGVRDLLPGARHHPRGRDGSHDPDGRGAGTRPAADDDLVVAIGDLDEDVEVVRGEVLDDGHD